MVILIGLIIAFGLFSYLYSLMNLNSNWYWCLYLFLGLLTTIILAVILIFSAIFIFKRTRYDGKIKHKIAWQVIDFIRIVLRVKIKVEGKENIPTETFVVVGNHKSMVDIIIVYYVYKCVMSAVAKNSLLKVPVLKDFMQAFEVVPIDRENDREGVKHLLHAIKLVKGGYNMLIFPEGGVKTKEYETMVGFKAGAFKLATKANATISPISIIGSSKIHVNYPWHKSKIKVLIHKPLRYEDYKDLNTHEIGTLVKEVVDNGVLNNKL